MNPINPCAAARPLITVTLANGSQEEVRMRRLGLLMVALVLAACTAADPVGAPQEGAGGEAVTEQDAYP